MLKEMGAKPGPLPTGASFAEVMKGVADTPATPSPEPVAAETALPAAPDSAPDAPTKDPEVKVAAAPLADGQNELRSVVQLQKMAPPIAGTEAARDHKKAADVKAMREVSKPSKKNASGSVSEQNKSPKTEAIASAVVNTMAVVPAERVKAPVVAASKEQRESPKGITASQTSVAPAEAVKACVVSPPTSAVAQDGQVAAQSLAKAPASVVAAAAHDAPRPVSAVSDGRFGMVIASATPRVEGRAASASAAPMQISRGGADTLQLQSYEASTPNRLEVGLRGGSYGWLNVRAERSEDGNVHALLRGSAEAAPVLQSHAAEMTSFLKEQSVPVAQVSVETSRNLAAVQRDAAAADAGAEQQRQQSPQHDTKPLQIARESGGHAIVSVPLGVVAQSGTALASTGGWLSVRV